MDLKSPRHSMPLGECGLGGWCGIRFHLSLAAGLLVAIALAIGGYSAHLREQALTAGLGQAQALEWAIQTARAIFAAVSTLDPSDLARASDEALRQACLRDLETRGLAMRAQVEEIRTIHAWFGASGGPGSDGGPATQGATQGVEALGRQAAEASDGLRAATAALGAASARRLVVQADLGERMERLRAAHGAHFEALTRVEVTVRAKVNRALAVGLLEAAQDGRLEARIDAFLEQELSWIATTQDLRADARSLLERAQALAEAPAPVPETQATDLTPWARRLDLYRRLPPTPAGPDLAAATTAYSVLALALPSLWDLRQAERTAEAEVAARLTAAEEAANRLKEAVYDLGQGMAEEGRCLLAEHRQRVEQVQRLLQGVALGAGFLVLGLIAYYLFTRVIGPLERLTLAMHRSHRRLMSDGATDQALAVDPLLMVGPHAAEIRVMAEALGALHRTLAEREHALLEQQDRLRHLAHHDALTGLPNRALLGDRIEQELSGARRRGAILAVALLDLDGFKAVNDQYGHPAGDALLVAAGQRIQAVLREGDTLARLGGDELALLLPDLALAADAERTLERVRSCLALPFDIGLVEPVRVSASIGYTLFPADQSPGDRLLRHADQAMYLAKRAGKDRVRRYRLDQTQDQTQPAYPPSVPPGPSQGLPPP